jgi:hypothetical protein
MGVRWRIEQDTKPGGGLGAIPPAATVGSPRTSRRFCVDNGSSRERIGVPDPIQHTMGAPLTRTLPIYKCSHPYSRGTLGTLSRNRQ